MLLSYGELSNTFALKLTEISTFLVYVRKMHFRAKERERQAQRERERERPHNTTAGQILELFSILVLFIFFRFESTCFY